MNCDRFPLFPLLVLTVVLSAFAVPAEEDGTGEDGTGEDGKTPVVAPPPAVTEKSAAAVSSSPATGDPEKPADPSAFGKELINEVTRATVTIEVPYMGNGSGFFFRHEGDIWVVSNAHVIGMASDVSLLNINDRSGNPVPVSSDVRVDLSGDLAMVRVDDSYQPQGVLEIGKDPSVGDPILAVGNAKGDGIIYPLEGEIKGIGSLHGVPIVEVSAKFVPGCSGGPVVDRQGRLVGVNAFIVSLQESEQKNVLFKDTPFAETRRMAVRAGRIGKTEKGKLVDLYVYNRASKDRIAVFVLYMLAKTADTSVKKDWVSREIDKCLKEADQPILRVSLRGVRRSGVLDDYYRALRSLQNFHQYGSVKAEQDYLLRMRKKLGGSAMDQGKQDYIDQAIDDRLESL